MAECLPRFPCSANRFRVSRQTGDLLERDLSKYTNVFIDESHRFRTETNTTYETLAQICRGKRVILVSATPLNNTPAGHSQPGQTVPEWQEQYDSECAEPRSILLRAGEEVRRA